MNILLVSQCHKNALKETRRILDQFAERCGDRTWQTPITQAGLNTLRKLLRQTARKNTAVACYWTHGKNLTELLWIVGDQNQFNEQGRVPTNKTRRNILRTEDENQWVHGTTIQIVATIAALLHDIGKANLGFAKKLKPDAPLQADPYRHEWISLRLFQALIDDCVDDESWLKRFTELDVYFSGNPDWIKKLINDEQKTDSTLSFDKLPPIAQLVSWLIVTHHRMPVETFYANNKARLNAQANGELLNRSAGNFYKKLKAVDGWVKNQKSNDERKDSKAFWQFSNQAMYSQSWQKHMKRWAGKALNHPPLMQLATPDTISDPFILHLARLSLMVGDHNYSSLKSNDPKRLQGDKDFDLIANTDSQGKPKQKLDEHLMGVGQFTARFSRLLPKFSQELPAIKKHKTFSQRTAVARFNWQNKAFDLARSLQESSHQNGFFGVNMASTGCGKTLGNARVMAALANPKTGVRFTIALGLRILTLQTGEALRQKLNLDDSSLAVLVGGHAMRELFNLSQQTQQNEDKYADHGSESMGELVEEIVHVSESGIDTDEFGTVIADPKARQLLYTPIISCTIDHLMAASENSRGGKHISPVLRLLSSDLILDEPDDFDNNDLPALSRLVYLSGLFGSRILLSSATLTPDLIYGLFSAYKAGRKIWNVHNQYPNRGIDCCWFDEHQQQHKIHDDNDRFALSHADFVEKRVLKLRQEPIRRIACVLPVDNCTSLKDKEIDYSELAKRLLHTAQQMHEHHHEICPSSKKQLSVGLIRFAHTRNIIQTVKAIHEQTLSNDTVHFHLCCYHARQLLILRNTLETKLDRILNRNKENALFEHNEIQDALAKNPAKNHIFIVISSPVSEVGRDHDYDWAIVEPSSMRSIIQLAGRIWRHRPHKIAKIPNIAIMNKNIRALKNNNGVAFEKPGFEDNRKFKLDTHNIETLIPEEQLNPINAIPRIQKPGNLSPKTRLADLEHAVIAHVLNNPKPNHINTFWKAGLSHPFWVQLQLLSPFRQQDAAQTEYICLPDVRSESGFSFIPSDSAWKNQDINQIKTVNYHIVFSQFKPNNPAVSPWLTSDLSEELEKLAEARDKDYVTTAKEFATISLEHDDEGKSWYFHPWLGFWR